MLLTLFEEPLAEIIRIASERRFTCGELPVVDVKEKISNREMTVILLREAVDRKLLKVEDGVVYVTLDGGRSF